MTEDRAARKLYVIERIFDGCRTAEELVADIIRAHGA